MSESSSGGTAPQPSGTCWVSTAAVTQALDPSAQCAPGEALGGIIAHLGRGWASRTRLQAQNEACQARPATGIPSGRVPHLSWWGCGRVLRYRPGREEEPCYSGTWIWVLGQQRILGVSTDLTVARGESHQTLRCSICRDSGSLCPGPGFLLQAGRHWSPEPLAALPCLPLSLQMP